MPVIFAIAYGVSDEVHQWFVPRRSFDPWDLVADAAGAVLAGYALHRWRHLVHARRGTSPPEEGW